MKSNSFASDVFAAFSRMNGLNNVNSENDRVTKVASVSPNISEITFGDSLYFSLSSSRFGMFSSSAESVDDRRQCVGR